MLEEDDVRETPDSLFQPLNTEFRFTLDACATNGNAKLSRYYSIFGFYDLERNEYRREESGGLSGSWAAERVWCNPPFSDITSWVRKAWLSEAELVVMLIPSTRTEQPWWQELIEPYRDRGQGLTVRFLPKRPRFLKDGVVMGSPKFGCCLLIWGA